jgi:hypothetical protein
MGGAVGSRVSTFIKVDTKNMLSSRVENYRSFLRHGVVLDQGLNNFPARFVWSSNRGVPTENSKKSSNATLAVTLAKNGNLDAFSCISTAVRETRGRPAVLA